MTQEEANKLILEQCTKEGLANGWMDAFIRYKREQEEKEKLQERINKAIDKLYCYGEVFDSKILQQFQKEMEDILQGSDN